MKNAVRVMLFVALGVCIGAGPAMARGTFLSPWQSTYPASLSDDNVINGTGKSCQLCHRDSSGGDPWNGYGWDIKLGLDAGLSTADAITAIEALNSDMDPGNFENYNPGPGGEIDQNTQPGWTGGPNNTIYFKNGTTATGQLPPGNILGNLDPVVGEPDINLNPASLDFGTVFIGDFALQTTAIENLGTADLTVTGIALCPSTSTEYTWSPNMFPITVPPGGNQTLSVVYTPADVGTDSGCLEISSNDPDENPATLTVVGDGAEPPVQEPDINLDPASLDFGTVFIGNVVTLTSQIQNLGTAELSVSAIARCASTSTEYTWMNTVPVTVPPGEFRDLMVTYTPLDEGTDAGCLELTTNDADENPAFLNLTGIGQTPGPAVVDLDIAQFRTTKRVSLTRVKPISIILVVKNGGSIDEQRIATVTGMQGGQMVYNQTMDVSDPVGDGRTRFNFPAYTPTASGDIMWTATITDDDPDVDSAMAVTRVVP
ncbi:MAG: choice-of-anchor D domain-containing protein [Candidatus Methylomirabilales bacterium]